MNDKQTKQVPVSQAVRKWLTEHGYPLEMKVAAKLRASTQWQVRQACTTPMLSRGSHEK